MRYGILVVRAAASLAAIGGASPVNLPYHQTQDPEIEGPGKGSDQPAPESGGSADPLGEKGVARREAPEAAREAALRPVEQGIRVVQGRAAHLARTLPLQMLPLGASFSGRLDISDDPVSAENVQHAIAAGKHSWPLLAAFSGGGTNPDAGSGGGEDGGKAGGGTNSGGGDSGSDGGGSTPPVGWPPEGGTDSSGGGQTDDGGLTLLPSPPTEPGNNPGGGTDGEGGGSVPHPPLPPVQMVPEPATWGIFTLGLFAVGFLMRRRRVNKPSAPAPRPAR